MKGTRKYTRRNVLRKAGSLGAGAAVGTVLSSRRAEAQSKKATAFALIGDRWHNFVYIRTAMTKTFVEDMELSVDFSCDHTLLSKENLKNYRLLILLMDGMTFPGGYTTPYFMYDPKTMKLVSDPPFPKMDGRHEMWIQPEQGIALKEFVESGSSALFYHNASYISGADENFRDVEGALFTGHTAFRPHKMQVVNHDHPITRDVKDFVITEEQHFLVYDKDPKYVLMRSVNEEGLEYKDQGSTCESCWACDYGRGRVCFMTPGHTTMSLWNPECVKLQQNAVRWLLREI